MIELDVAKILLGAAFIGDVVELEGFALPEFLHTDNRGFEKAREFLVFQTYVSYEVTEEEYNHPQVLEHYTRLQAYIRNIINTGIRNAANQEIEEAKKLAAKIQHDAKARIDEINKPNPAGTVSELAEKLGVSKSEIRRMKAAGTLNDHIKEKANENKES